MSLPHPSAPEAESKAHKQKRAFLTRQKLIWAARRVFAQNGFEHARIEDIAARAGKTRGAFYDNFKDKEDIFFAIIEDDIGSDQQKFLPRLQAAATSEDRIEAVADRLMDLLHDRQRVLLNLEFKLYVIRHPRKQKRLAALHAAVLVRCVMTELGGQLPELARLPFAEKQKRLVEFAATVDGYALNKLFTPANLDDPTARQALVRNLRATLFKLAHPPSHRPRKARRSPHSIFSVP